MHAGCRCGTGQEGSAAGNPPDDAFKISAGPKLVRFFPLDSCRVAEKYAAAASALQRLLGRAPCPLVQEAAAAAVIERQQNSPGSPAKRPSTQQFAAKTSRKISAGGREIEVEITL